LFSLQNWMAALVCSVYVLWVWREFPAFFSEVVPLVADTYVSMRAPLGNLLFMSGLLIWWLSLPLLYWLARGDLSSATRLVPLAASCGFALAFLIQGKLWPYQSYPALAVCCFLLGVAFFERFHGASGPPDNRSPRLATNFLVALAIGASWLWFLLGLDVSGLAAPIRALKPNPKIISLSDDLGVGFPVTRDVGGEWVGRKPSLWVRTFADRVRRDADPAAATRLRAYVDAERKMFAEDVMRGRPDIILWQREPDANWPDWAKTEPGLAEALEVYRARETVDGVTILSRDETP
jgi:hypothetical protein